MWGECEGVSSTLRGNDEITHSPRGGGDGRDLLRLNMKQKTPPSDTRFDRGAWFGTLLTVTDFGSDFLPVQSVTVKNIETRYTTV
jgi:hypothetical protein